MIPLRPRVSCRGDGRRWYRLRFFAFPKYQPAPAPYREALRQFHGQAGRLLPFTPGIWALVQFETGNEYVLAVDLKEVRT